MNTVIAKCGCVCAQPTHKPSLFWTVTVPCSEHAEGDQFVDDLRMSAHRAAVRTP